MSARVLNDFRLLVTVYFGSQHMMLGAVALGNSRFVGYSLLKVIVVEHNWNKPRHKWN